MIYGELTNWEKEKGAFSGAIVRAIEYLRANDFESMETGTYEIEGKLMYASVQERDTKPKSELKAESHLQYIDVQYIVRGEEVIGFARQSDRHVVTDDLVEKHDTYLYSDLHNEIGLIMHEGNFVVFFPDDVHRPCGVLNEEMTIKKVVIKLHTSLI